MKAVLKLLYQMPSVKLPPLYLTFLTNLTEIYLHIIPTSISEKFSFHIKAENGTHAEE
jgi:hypothetical protein